MKQVNSWLSNADKAIQQYIIEKPGKINSLYKGYVSSLGAMIIQNGLSAALAINMKSDDKLRNKMVESIAFILKASGKNAYSSKGNFDGKTLLNESCNADKSNNIRILRLLKNDVLDAATALKLMMRTYEFVEQKNENHG
jgi:CRISPR/Cas system CMR-associated protein Cmr5 small subunit